MPTFHNKLVRDLIPKILQTKGVAYQVQILSPSAYEKALRQKLMEEAQEVEKAASNEELIQEIADVREVLDALMVIHQIPEDKILEVQQQKRQTRGGFQHRLKLLWTSSCVS